ncbi:MAG TPA: TraB/GumN family protein [Sphingomonadaceae bacterium]|nr:TraB/GumN family protein [Sphingomonadaceae bacterium]
MFALAGLAAAPSAAQSPPLPPQIGDAADEIVITAQRSGIPVWRVTGPRTTVVLVGSIGSVAPGTRWDPVPLDAALVKANRVMFPESLAFGGGVGTMFSALGQWRKQATLPKGQTLQQMTTPAQWARLVALRDKGVLKPGFERKHPFHLALSLRHSVRDKRKLSPGADQYVRRFLGKNKTKRVPMTRGDTKALMAELFKSAPRAHVACLMDSVALAEAGAGGVRARVAALKTRSDAWATRRVPEAVAAFHDDHSPLCWPKDGRLFQAHEARLSPAVRSLMNKPEVTLAVVSLDSLAERGGVLDDLVAAGFDVRGPRWKR